tara:strand:+ start:1535 stop:2965 length:1431 start_codon:yes stop_codon:yes gene_type:complete
LKRSQWVRLRSKTKGGRNTAFFVYYNNMEKQAGFKNYVLVDSSPKNTGEKPSDFEKSLVLKYLKNLRLEIPQELIYHEDEGIVYHEDEGIVYHGDKDATEDATKDATEDATEVEKLKLIADMVGCPTEDKDGRPLDQPQNEQEPEVKIVNSNFFYNSYFVSTTTGTYLLKISLDPENKKLKTENQALKSITSLFSPEVLDYRLDEEYGVEFLLTRWENGSNFENLGIDEFIYNMGTFSAVLDSVHESSIENIPSFEDRFKENESIFSVKEKLNPKEVAVFEKLVDLSFDDLEALFLKIREDFLIQYQEDIPVLCHSNLKFSNILYQSEYIKVINLEHSHVSDIYYSLLKVINNTGLYYSDKKVKEFLSKYHEHSRILGDLDVKTFIKNFESKRELNRVLIFQDLVCKIIFHFFAYGAFAKKKTLNHYMYIYLNIKPTIEKMFPEQIKSFDKLFFTVMPTVKTYDIEKLKLIADMVD